MDPSIDFSLEPFSNETLNFTIEASFDAELLNDTYYNCSNTTCVPEGLLVTSAAPSAFPSFAPSVKPTSAPKPPSVGLIESTDTTVLVSTIQVYGTLYLILWALFCILRTRYNFLYNIRSWVPELQCDIAKNMDYGQFPLSLISWMWKVFQVDEDDILEQCGMDALCFIRVLRIGRNLAAMGCLQACWLIPVYITAEDSNETRYLTDSLVLISTAHLPTGSPRFLATVICAYVCFGYAMWLIQRELQWYTNKRHTFLKQRRPRNYAVYVSGIPEELRSGAKLAEFFRQSGATSSVLEAEVTLACPHLEGLVAQREDAKARLEHAKAFEEINGKRKTSSKLNLRGLARSPHRGLSRSSGSNRSNALVEHVDSVQRLEKRIRQLTKDIAIGFQYIERSNDPYSLEEHRNMVMEEIEETRRAERAQNIATRERVHSFHDTDLVEEICHVEEEEGVVMEEALPVNDQFSKVAEAFFFGSLKPQPKPQEQRKLLQNHQEDEKLWKAKTEDEKKVMIRSSHNQVHYMSSRGSIEDPCEEYDGFEDESEEKKTEHQSRNRSSGAPTLLHGFPSKSTITTVPGTFDRQSPAKWTHKHFLSSQDDRSNNLQKQEVVISFSNEGPASMSSSDDESGEDDGYARVRAAIRRKGGKDEDESDSECSSSGRSSGQSWTTKTTSVIRRVSQGVQNLGGDVGKTVVDVGTGVGKATKKSLKAAGDIGMISNITKVGELGVKNVNKLGLNVAELGVENMKTIRQSAAAVVPVVMAHEEGKALEGGFVVFKDLYSTQAALQMLHHKEPGVMEVEAAPGPDEIFWRNVGLPGTAKRTGRLLSLAATVVLCLFWTVPTSFISALTEVNSLKENVPVLGRWVEKYPSLEDALALIAPLLLLILQDVLLPEFLAWFAAWEGHISSSITESAVFVKYAAFVLVQTFFISAISGSISAELGNMINEPDQFVDFLANALPAQSNYFLQILVVAIAINMGLEMLRVGPLGLAFLRRFVGPNLTEDERRKRWKFFTPLEDPKKFEHANVSGSVVLYFMVFFVYCCLAPVSCFFLLIMFFLMESGYRYNFYHNYPPTPDSGGKHWLGFFHILLSCMIVAQLTLVGFLLLKKSLYAIPFMVPLLVVSFLFIFYLNNYKLRASFHLPTGDCVEEDQRHRLRDFDFAKGKYIQPCIQSAQSDTIFDII